jgi:hypothetical protein
LLIWIIKNFTSIVDEQSVMLAFTLFFKCLRALFKLLIGIVCDFTASVVEQSVLAALTPFFEKFKGIMLVADWDKFANFR